MPTSSQIRHHWAERLVTYGKFDSVTEVLEADYCFACGLYYPLDPNHKAKNTVRAHILAICNGGTNDADNLHNLCQTCHDDSEYLSGDEYWQWFQKRSWMDVLISRLARHGENLLAFHEALNNDDQEYLGKLLDRINNRRKLRRLAA